MPKPTYDCNVPNQRRLKIARAKIEAILKEHDIAGVVVLHTPGMAEFFYDVRPSYSCVTIEQDPPAMRLRSKLVDYQGDAARQLHDATATSNMLAALADNLGAAGAMFQDVSVIADTAFNATQTNAVFVPDPGESQKH